MKKAFLLALGILFFYNQQDTPYKPVPCTVQPSLEEPFWLKEKLADLQKNRGMATIYRFLLNDEIIYSIEQQLGADARTTTYYHYLGTVACRTVVTLAGPTGNCNLFARKLTDRTLIYPKREP